MEDDIGKYLVERVPPPSDGYWESIDNALDEDSSEIVQPFIRPTDMTNKQPRGLWLMATAAVVALCVGGVVFAFRNTTETEVASDVDTSAPQSETPPSTATGESALDEIGSTTTEQGQSSEQNSESTTTLTTIEPTTSTAAGEQLPLQAFDVEAVVLAGFEAVGCWFETDNNVDTFEPLLYAGEAGAFLILGGTPIEVAVDLESEEIDFGARTSYASGGYQVTLTELGEPETTSIESSDRSATLMVSTPDGSLVEVTGVLGCGV